jgi:glycerol-1-phosphate dehydrogenase [NAD(P)+]
MVIDAVNRLLEHIPAIRQRSEQGIRVLIEALLLAGVTIMVIGHTRAVASIEHNIVHYWDMMKLMEGQKQPTHGTAVGIATLQVWPLYQRFAREDLSQLNLEAIRARRMERTQREWWLLNAYQEEAAREIIRENPEDFLTWTEQARRIGQAQAKHLELKAVIDAMPPFEQVRQAFLELGAPLQPADLDIDTRLLNRSMHAAKDYRSRYSLFKLLDECGLLQDYLSDYPWL